ncbi:Uu.00g145320.m01.CDS01 [Anthostomella pinea]|uniref:Uu.00g145320.m01.CDS01 n=1 Tax=Anthostomella pinea TaxID=933095 RepID=A0AAI8VR00_9PEZI|nr:Uu.00g145320.m01.CDS01 [Anthostomella pinea]
MTSLYAISIPVLANVLKVTSTILKKGEQWAKEQKMSSADLLALRIYDDMLPLGMQVWINVVTTKKAIERLTGTAPPQIEGREKTIEELYAMIDDTLKELAQVKKEDVDDRDGVEVPCVFGKNEYKTSLVEYVHGYPIPTVYFHLNMIYAILRGKGVSLGKMDYMEEFMAPFTKIN